MSKEEQASRGDEPFQFPTVMKRTEVEDNELKIDADEEENDVGGFATFDFQFDDFPQEGMPDTSNDDSAFVFDANEKDPDRSKEGELFGQFTALLKNPCFESPRSLIELFKQDDATESVDAAFEVLMKGN